MTYLLGIFINWVTVVWRVWRLNARRLLRRRNARAGEFDVRRVRNRIGVEFSPDADPAPAADESAAAVAVGGPFATEEVVVLPAV